eukprot:7435609-Karenia_brevis.AAC.1
MSDKAAARIAARKAARAARAAPAASSSISSNKRAATEAAEAAREAEAAEAASSSKRARPDAATSSSTAAREEQQAELPASTSSISSNNSYPPLQAAFTPLIHGSNATSMTCWMRIPIIRLASARGTYVPGHLRNDQLQCSHPILGGQSQHL